MTCYSQESEEDSQLHSSGAKFSGRYARFAGFVLGLFLLLSSHAAFAALGASVTLASGQPTTIYPSEITQIQITLSNNNTSASVSNVAFSASLPGTLPNGLKISGAATYTCTDPSGPTTGAGAGTLTAADGTQAISLSGGIIPARANSTDGTCTITIPVTAGTSTGNATTYTYTIPDGSVTGDDGTAVANSGAVSQSVNIRALTKPVITKTFSNSTAVLGGSAVTLTLKVTNSNPVALPNFDISDTFPLQGGTPLIKVASAPAATSTCTGSGTAPAFSPSADDVSLSATGGTVEANGSCTITVAVVANHTNGAYLTGFSSNTINGASDFSSDIGIVPANASANIRTRSPLNVSKSFAHSSVSDGQSDTLSITLSNTGTSALTVNSFTDDPIDGIGNAGYGLKVSGSPSVVCSGAGTAGTYAATAGNTGVTQTADTTIAGGGNCVITVPFTATVQTANTPVSYTNSIAAGAVGTATAGVVSQNASASVLVADNLRVTKTISPTSAAPGNPVKYTVTVQNYSGSALSDTAVTDHLTNSQTYLTGTINGLDFSPSLSGTGCSGLSSSAATGDTDPAFTVTTIPARVDTNTPSACTITFWAMTNPSASNGSSYSNVISAGDVCYNSGATCNGGSSNTVSGTITTAVLSLAKAFSPAGPLSEGTITRMTFTFTNRSANALTAVSLSDTLPVAGSGGQLRVASPANAASTCGTPTITATAGSTSVSMNGATVPARASSGTGSNGTCILQVDVVGPAGSYTNTGTAAGTETQGDGSTTSVGPVNANASITYNSALSATKSFSPASVSSGGLSTVTLRLTNSGSGGLTNVSATDPLPSGMVLASPVNSHTTCAGSPVITGAAGASSISMTGGSLAGGGTCDLQFDVVATGSADWINTIPIGNITADSGVSNQTAVTGTLTYDPPTDITVAKATSPSTLTFPGQVSQLTITVMNGTLATTNLGFTDYFTADGTSGGSANGMVIAPTPAASTTCPGGAVTASAGGTQVQLSGASLAANATCTVSVNVSATKVGGITNFIPAGSISTDQGITNSGQASTSLTTQSNLGVTKQFTPNIIEPGDRSRLRITFFNPTAQPASGVAVTDTLPSGVTVPSGPNAVTTCAGATVSSPASNQVEVSGGNIPAASGSTPASCYAEIDVTSSSEGDYVNTIPANGVTATIGGAPAKNSQPASDTLHVKTPVTINKAIDGDTLDSGNPAGFTTGTATRTPGSAATMTIKLTNPNSAALTEAAFTDTFPSGLAVATTPSASTTCSGGTVTAPASATQISLTGATIPASGSCTVTVNVLSNVSATYTNTIPASALTTFEGVTNDEPTSAALAVSTPPVVTKQFDPAVIPPSGISHMTVFISNDNTSAFTLTSALTDTLPTAPGNIVVASTPNITKTCPGTVTAAASSGTVTYANGASVPAGGCSYTVDVTGSVSGDYTNNIPAGALTTTFGNNQQPANAGLTISTLGYISGRVFADNNVTPNGTFESGTDSALSGVSIELHSGSSCSSGLLTSQTTDAAGNYTFSGLAGGTYSVCEPTQPTGTTNGTTTAGAITSVSGSTGTAGAASNPTSTTSQIVTIVLNADGSGSEVSGSGGNDFAEIIPSTISGTVFEDQNNNGVQNGSDTGLSGVTVNLTGTDVNSNAVSTSTTTASDGSYSFASLQPGTYTVTEPTQPANTSNGLTVAGSVPNGGTAGSVTGTTTVPSQISAIILPPDTTASGNNFAELPNGHTLSGTVFLDYANDGTKNGSDYGISGQTVNLTGTDVSSNPVSATTTTDTNGDFTFTALPSGTYTIDQPAQPTGTTNGTTTAGSAGGTPSNPTGTTSRIANIDLTTAGSVSTANLFAEVPGAAPDLTIAKTHTPASFGEGSSTGYFTITPSNVGAQDTSGAITVVDTLPTGMTLKSTPTGTGWTCTGVAGDSTSTCTSTDVISASGTGNVITLPVTVGSGYAGMLLVNNVTISGGGEPPGFGGNNSASDTVAITTTASVSGTVWRDTNHNRQIDSGEELVQGWEVQLKLSGVTVDTTTTDASGAYSFTGISPGSGYQLLFVEPTTGIVFGNAVTNEQGITPTNGVRDTGSTTVNSGTNTGNPAGADLSSANGTLPSMNLLAGDNIIQQSLPLDPSGVVYDAITRAPVQGAQLTLTGPAGFNPATQLVGGSATVTTPADGSYQFLLTPAAPSGTYTITVSTYPGGYLPVPSTFIAVCNNTLAVGAAPDPALIQSAAPAPTSGATIHDPTTCPASTAALAPANQATTQYYMSFTIDPATSGDVVNNHIPLDPILGGAVQLTKTTPLVNVTTGQLVPYTITAHNTLSAALSNIDIVDTLPPGFKYKTGSATLDGVAVTPTVSGRTLTVPNLTLAIGATRTLKMLLVVGAGVQPGKYVNAAQAINNIVTTAVSNTATATVNVTPDPLFDCTDIIGKVFNDKNANGYEDEGEPGIPAVRVATVNGLLVTTDADGRFHIACAAIPDSERGSNFIMKLDTRTLPTGFRVTTENPRIVRATRGKMVKLNFGAALRRVVRVNMRDDAFLPGSTELKPGYAKQFDALPAKLKETPSILRLGYVETGEGEKLARKRLKAVADRLRKLWKKSSGRHELQIEEELLTKGKAGSR
ncbi:MAG: DUF11 domain-containing protein [Alphaproteobacteria bacterium]|nr:DUF11 domain-containing protein [Alphaproteobacteria bacterium]